MRRLFPSEYDFCPMTFIFPEDYKRFIVEREDNPKILWIMKPVASSCGRGIKMVSRKSKVKNKSLIHIGII